MLNKNEIDARKLEKITLSTLYSPKYKAEFDYIKRKLSLSDKQIIDAVIHYSLNLNTFDNLEYNSNALLTVLHLHNCVQGSYHQKRQKIIEAFLQNRNWNTLIDIGFGVPSSYVFNNLKKGIISTITLADKDKTAIDFASILLEYHNSSFRQMVDFKIIDMNDSKQVGKYDVYLFLDSIEHAYDPTDFLKRTIKYAPQKARFILALPICSKESLGNNFHYIEWLNKTSAIEWLKSCGLKVKQSKKIDPVSGIDIFAERIKGGFYNLIVECFK